MSGVASKEFLYVLCMMIVFLLFMKIVLVYLFIVCLLLLIFGMYLITTVWSGFSFSS